MKNFFLCILFLGVLSCTSNTDIVIENPPFSVDSHSNVFITEIRMNEKATFLTLTIDFEPNSRYAISSETYIRVNGEKYDVKSAEGIEFDKDIKSDKSGKAVFTLEFDPVDRDAKRLDFFESDCDRCFKIWGVELKSNVLTNRQEVPQEVKDAAIVTDDGGSLEIPQLKEGSATIKGRLMGYVPDMGWEVLISTFDPITGMEERFKTPVLEDGSFDLQVNMITTMQAYFHIPVYSGHILLSPDKETTVYFDLQQRSCQKAQHRVDKCQESKYVYFGGANAEINNQINDLNILQVISDLFYSEQVYRDISGMTAAKYKSYILYKMNRGIRELQKKGMTKKTFEFAMINMRLKASYMLLSANSILASAYASTTNIKEDGVAGYKSPELDDNYFSFLKELDINHQMNLYCSDFLFLINTISYVVGEEKMKETIESSDGIFYDLMKTQQLGINLKQDKPITEKEFSDFPKMENRFYYDHLKEKNNRLLAKIEAEKNRKGFNLNEVYKDESEILFSELLKPYAGNVILVDFWATWCMPCLFAIQQFESTKKELMEKGVVFVYLTNETSMLNTWNDMTLTISGEHIRLKDKQYNPLANKFGVEAIPAYIILNKKGEQVYFNTGFESVQIMTDLLTKELNM